MIAKINKLPFFLWQSSILDDCLISENLNKIIIDERKFNLVKVNPILIFILKYLPVLFLFYYTFNINFEVIKTSYQYVLIAISIFVVSSYFFNRYLKYFHIYLFILAIINAILVLKFDLAFELEFIMTYLYFISIIGIVLIDILQENYKKYYYLDNYVNETKINLAKKHKKRFLFKNRNMGFNLSFKVPIKGYFIRIDKWKS